MNPSENRPDIPATPAVPTPQMPQGAVVIAPEVQTQQIRQAMEQMERKKNRGKVTRRVLLGAAGVGVCAGAIEAAPFIVEKAGYYTKQELDQALQNGVAQGREELLAELRNLEGIGLDAAIAIAKLTKFAVQNIVKPLLDLDSAIQSHIIATLLGGVLQAQAILAGLNIHIGALNEVEALLRTWQANGSQDLLGQLAVQDVTAAETYLEALQQKINGQTAKG